MSRRHNCERDDRNRDRNNCEENNGREGNEVDFERELERFIGRTVTIFTTSGGESGRGFTGVLIRVSNTFVTLITQIGPGPSCALGNACTDRTTNVSDITDDEDEFTDRRRTITDRRRVIRNLGAETDIPINRIASFVHNAI